GTAEDRRNAPAAHQTGKGKHLARLVLLFRRELAALLHATAELNSDRRLWSYLEQGRQSQASPGPRATLARLLTGLFGLLVVACGASSSAATSGQRVELRLGLYANLTHAPALIGVRQGVFATALGPDVTLTTATFNAGPDAVTALLSSSIDAAYVGPNPAINAFTRSHGQAVRIVSGATSGGASLVVRPSISSPADLKGRVLATPPLG